MTRNDILLASIDQTHHGLEIGPLCWPVLKKNEAKIEYVDHATTQRLLELYKDDPGVPSDQIVPIDYPLEGRSLHDSVSGKKFGYIIASHVIEHVPDMISWLNDMASVLKPDGVLSLAIPDKRFTFDIDRNVSRPSDVIGAYLDKHTKPDAGTVFDYHSNYRSKVDPGQAWDGQLYLSEEAGPHRYSDAEAVEYAIINRDTDTYVDTHCFVYTPASFIALLRSLINLQLLPYSVADFSESSPGQYEFFVTLKKAKPSATKQLLDSLPVVTAEPSVREFAAQVQQLESEITELKQQLTVSDHLYQNIIQSRSWKMTSPLRKAKKRLRPNSDD